MALSKSIFLLPEVRKESIYNESAVAQIQKLTRNDGYSYSREEILANPASFEDVRIVFSGWGAPVMDEELLNALPALEIFIYGAGSVKRLVTEEFWRRGIILTSAYTANAIPVAEFTVAMTIISLKRVWDFNRTIRKGEGELDRSRIPGVYSGTKVGIISLGAIGRLVCRKLSELELDVYAVDPYADDSVFAECGATKAESLEWLFEECEVVTLHAPWLPETENMITGGHFRRMSEGATFINTSRGMIVDESAMMEVLRERPEIYAVLDVIQDEGAYGRTPLGRLPNVFLTPHIGGSMGRECHRMGDQAVAECRRFLNGEPQQTPITRDNVHRLA